MTDEEAVARFPAASYMEVPDSNAPLGGWGVIVRNGTAWIFETARPRPIDKAELDSRGARPCKPSDAVELIPAGAPDWNASSENDVPLIPPNPFWENDARVPAQPISDQEQKERVDILLELERLDDEINRLTLRRKQLVERLGQVRERN